MLVSGRVSQKNTPFFLESKRLTGTETPFRHLTSKIIKKKRLPKFRTQFFPHRQTNPKKNNLPTFFQILRKALAWDGSWQKLTGTFEKAPLLGDKYSITFPAEATKTMSKGRGLVKEPNKTRSNRHFEYSK